MKIRQLKTIEKSTILGLHNAKITSASIAKQLDMPKTNVFTILKNIHMQEKIQ